jgi:hypothetical protein
VESISQSDALNRPLGLSPSISLTYISDIKMFITARLMDLREMWIADGEIQRRYAEE